jgi:transcriptional antiterminator RfaH
MSSERFEDTTCWHAIRTHPKQEDRAASNLEAWGVETLYPKFKEPRRNPFTGVPVYTTKPLFPGYIFAKFKANHNLHKVKYTRGVQSVVGFGNGPLTVDDDVISLIRSRILEDGFVRIGEDFDPGNQVLIKEGPLKSLMGIFEHRMSATGRVMILLTAVTYQGRVSVESQLLAKVS